jgi:hypothetical protein
MTLAQRTKHVFGIDIEVCPSRGVVALIIACIERSAVVEQSPSCRSVNDQSMRRPRTHPAVKSTAPEAMR